MRQHSNIAIVASLVSEPSRAALLTVLLDGRYHAASELADQAGIKPPTASFHLAKMVEAQVVSVEKQGRHRYYGIQDQEVAEVLESLLSIAPPVPVKSLKQALNDHALRSGRTCYDHLGGALGHALFAKFLELNWIERLPESRAVRITAAGRQGLKAVFFIETEQQ